MPRRVYVLPYTKEKQDMDNNSLNQTDKYLTQFYNQSGPDKGMPNKRYLISSRDEIVYTIGKISENNELITVFLENTNEFLITALVGIDEKDNCLYIDNIADVEKREHILACKSVTITSQSRGIKYLFPVSVMGKALYEGSVTIKLALPDYVLKLQRREYFRAIPPLDHSLKCELRNDGGSFNIDVADISEGGVNLVDRNNNLFIRPNTILKSCRINLPTIGTIESDLIVHRVDYPEHDVTSRTKYIGCEYIDPSNMMTSIIRRYIWKVERFSRSGEKAFN